MFRYFVTVRIISYDIVNQAAIVILRLLILNWFKHFYFFYVHYFGFLQPEIHFHNVTNYIFWFCQIVSSNLRLHKALHR